MERHFGEFRDGAAPLPYACHPVEVAGLLRAVGGVTEVDWLCAAFMHDVLEETMTTAEELSARFGPEVAGLVVELTRREPSVDEIAGLSKAEVWELRSGILLREIREMGRAAQTVKLADRLSNVREAKRTKSPEKLARYLRQTAEILAIIPREVNPGLWDAVSVEASLDGDGLG